MIAKIERTQRTWPIIELTQIMGATTTRDRIMTLERTASRVFLFSKHSLIRNKFVTL